MDIAKAFEDKNIPTIQIQAENVARDIEIFARGRVETLRKGEHGKTLYVTSANLTQKLIRTLAHKADGMFLWVNLQLDSVCEISKAQKDRLVEDALEALPQGLPETYTRILERIERQPPYMRELALNCLAWMIYARRPLNTKELQAALATKSSGDRTHDSNPDKPAVILEACGNLLEEAHGVIRPIHYTVQEFLSKPEPRSKLPENCFQRQLSIPNEMHIWLGEVCLEYIRLVAFNQPVDHAIGLYSRLQDNPFVSYACHNFDYHFARCDYIPLDARELLEALLQMKSKSLAAILQIMILRDGFNDYSTIQQQFDPMRFPVSAGTIVYSNSLYDISEVRERWVDDVPPTYALHRACSAGLATAVDRLLDAGCDIKERDGNGGTPLYFASLEGHCQIMQTLLDIGADVHAQGGYYGNALQAASNRGHEAVVKLLLDK
ncbi:ankyrin, partial [Polyplosphaeria fusca]